MEAGSAWRPDLLEQRLWFNDLGGTCPSKPPRQSSFALAL